MVDITGKPYSYREAEAKGSILLRDETIRRIKENRIEKGNVIEVAKIAAIQAVKRTPEIVPLCHPIKVTSVDVEHSLHENSVVISVKVSSPSFK